MYCGSPSPLSRRSFSFAWAMSRPTIIVPFRERRVETGYCESCARISFIGRFRSTRTASPSPALRSSSGMYLPGLFSSFSIQMPSRLIFALMLRSAEQETPIPTGQEAPWRGRRITRMSCAKYLPPNCAPSPRFCASASSSCSSCTSRNA